MTTVTCPIGTWGTAIAAIDKVAATLGRKAYDADPDAPVQLEYVRPEKSGQVDADSIQEDWSPEFDYHADLKEHPAKLIQSETFTTVSPTFMSYRPKLPRRVISSGFIPKAWKSVVLGSKEYVRVTIRVR